MNKSKIINLVNLAKGGDEVAFERLFLKYQGLLLKLSQKYSNMCPEDTRDFDDFLQESKIAFFRAIETYDEEQKRTFGAYAKVCIRNRLISCVRALNSQKRNKERQKKKMSAVGTENVVQEHYFDAEELKKVRIVAPQVLSRYEYKIFEMYFVLGMRTKEISQKLNKEEKSVNNAIYRMKTKIIRHLKK